jgi:hypothetical protein
VVVRKIEIEVVADGSDRIVMMKRSQKASGGNSFC